MDYLLDTHALIWFLEGNENQLPEHIVKQLVTRDPFDRLIISQAQVKNLTVVSKDRAFKNYPVKLLWELE